MSWMWFCLAAPFVLCFAAGLWRFMTLRKQGYPVVFRPLPNADGRNWRHGVLVYSGTCARFFKLRSLRPESDLALGRHDTEIIDRRPVALSEAHILEDDLHILRLKHKGREWELAVDSRGDTAMVSWLESAPSSRRVRVTRFTVPGRR